MAHDTQDLARESRKALNKAVQDTLETLAFAEALPLDQHETPVLAEPSFVTTVEVKRPYCGRIRLMISHDLAISLIGSMLGRSGPIEEEWVQDGLSELVNTIGGRILAHLVESSSSFDLGIPQTERVNGLRPAAGSVMVYQAYAVHDGHLALELDFQKAQAACSTMSGNFGDA